MSIADIGKFIEVKKTAFSIAVNLPVQFDFLQIKIQGQEIKNFQGLTIEQEIDSPCTAFSFTTFFDPKDADSRRLFRPYQAQNLSISYYSKQIIEGSIDVITPAKTTDGINVNIQGRTLNSWSVDSNRLGDIYFRNITLGSLSKKLLGDTTVFPDTPPIPVIKIEKMEKVYEAIAKEAAQRGYWCIPSLGKGTFFAKISQSDPVQAELEEGEDPVMSVKSSFDRSKRYSEYLILGSGNGNGRSATVMDNSINSSFDLSSYRFKIVQASKENADLQAYGQRVRNEDQIDSFTCEVQVSSWTFNDRLWSPGGMIELKAPGAMIYKKSKFVIKKVSLTYDETGEKATLSLALPNAFDGSTLSTFPWDDPPIFSLRDIF